jgi:hypothetical protein
VLTGELRWLVLCMTSVLDIRDLQDAAGRRLQRPARVAGSRARDAVGFGPEIDAGPMLTMPTYRLKLSLSTSLTEL